MNCPLCNNGSFGESGGYLVCEKCCEMLTRAELVRKANRRTKRKYCISNFGRPTYPGE